MADLDSRPTPEPGPARPRCGPFRLVRRLSVGFLAETFLAEIPRAATQSVAASGKRPIVLKRALPTAAEDPELRAAFDWEVTLARTLAHPNLVAGRGDGEHRGLPFLLLAHVPGSTLADARDRVVAEGRGWPPSWIAWVGQAVAAALRYLHDLRLPLAPRGLLHQDISPSNLLLAADGGVKVADLGALVPAGSEPRSYLRQATPRYAAPEQLAGEPPGPASDLYSLALVLVELLLARRVRPRTMAPEDRNAARHADVAALAQVRGPSFPDLLSQLSRLLRVGDGQHPSARGAVRAFRREARDPEAIRRAIATWVRRGQRDPARRTPLGDCPARSGCS